MADAMSGSDGGGEWSRHVQKSKGLLGSFTVLTGTQ